MTAGVRLHLNNLNLTMGNYIFDRTERIKIFDFLSGFVKEVDMLNTDAQHFFLTQIYG